MRLKSNAPRAHALVAVTLVFALSGCGGFSGIRRPPAGVDGVRCVGRVASPPFAAKVVSDDALLAEALGASGKGGICAGKAFVVQEDVRVYRLWDSSRAWSVYGRWWSLTRPAGSRETYRSDYAICPAWSALDRLTSCTIKAGTVIVIGPTQSAACDTGGYPKSALNQVYIRNDAAKGQMLVADCHDEGLWPATAK
jgi:hypothetical protein